MRWRVDRLCVYRPYSLSRVVGVLLLMGALSHHLCSGQALEEANTENGSEHYHIREIVVDNWNVGLHGTYGEIVVDDSVAVVWRDHNPNCGARRIDAESFGAMPYSVSKPFVLDTDSRLTFFHSLGYGGEHPDTLKEQFPNVNMFWRLRLADAQSRHILATVDSMALNPKHGYGSATGFFTSRLLENMSIVFGSGIAEQRDHAVCLLLDFEPMYLDGMDYNYTDHETRGYRYSDRFDEIFGYSIMDTIRSYGYQILDVCSRGYGSISFELAVPEVTAVRLVLYSDGSNRCIYDGEIPAGHIRILTKCEVREIERAELLDSDGRILTSYKAPL